MEYHHHNAMTAQTASTAYTDYIAFTACTMACMLTYIVVRTIKRYSTNELRLMLKERMGWIGSYPLGCYNF